MKFILGFITGWIVFVLALIGFYFYFDVDSYTPIKTDDLDELQQQADYNKGEQAKEQEVIQENQTQEIEEPQQEKQQPATAKIEPNKNKEIKEKEQARREKEKYPKQKHNNAGVNNYKYAKEHGMTDDTSQ